MRAGSGGILNKRMLWMLIGCTLLFGGIFAFKLTGSYMMNKALDNQPLPPATVSATEVERQVWQETLSAVGTLRAVNGVEVTSEAQGVIKAIYFESGQRVGKGELLVELSAEPQRAEIMVREAALRLAQRNYDRIKILHSEGVSTDAELDDARSALDQASANLAVQRAIVSQRSVYAPFSGQVGIRQVDLGENVSPGQAVVSLQQLEPIYANFSLPERHFARVRRGLQISLTTSAFPDRKFTGRITAIDPQVDEASRNFQLQATLANPKHQLHPGMFAEVTVELAGSRSVLVVPRTAISFAPFGNSVFAIQGSEKGDGLVAIKRFVKTGEERGDLVEITEGARVGERVATSGLLKLRNEGAVTINNDNPPPANPNPHPENG